MLCRSHGVTSQNTVTLWYIYIFVNCNWVDTRWQQYSTRSHTNSTQNITMKLNTQNGSYIILRIHERYLYKIKQKHTKHKTICIKWYKVEPKEYDVTYKRNSHISSKPHMIYISSNNDRHPVTKTFTTLHPTTFNSTLLHLSTLHIFPFKRPPTTLHHT
jgi:hypothetical protein